MSKKSNRRKFIEKSIASAIGVTGFSSCVKSNDKEKQETVNVNFNNQVKETR